VPLLWAETDWSPQRVALPPGRRSRGVSTYLSRSQTMPSRSPSNPSTLFVALPPRASKYGGASSWVAKSLQSRSGPPAGGDAAGRDAAPAVPAGRRRRRGRRRTAARPRAGPEPGRGRESQLLLFVHGRFSLWSGAAGHRWRSRAGSTFTRALGCCGHGAHPGAACLCICAPNRAGPRPPVGGQGPVDRVRRSGRRAVQHADVPGGVLGLDVPARGVAAHPGAFAGMNRIMLAQE
jgi:hypothetical protein